MEKNLEKKNIYIYICELNHFTVYLKHCKTTFFNKSK